MVTGVADKIYQDIANRTGGDIYLGIVGPVRTGKSTFVKRFMETIVIPYIDNIYQKERAMDELPLSGSGKTIMTAEPKFVPEEAVTITPDGVAKLSVRLIDSVGYLVPGAIGAEENGQPRMVTTPWFPQEVSMAEAAELGTKKVMEDHCTIGIVMTTDGTVTGLQRQDYVEAERRAIMDMQATGKPFVVLVNSADPQGGSAVSLCQELSKRYGAVCRAVDCLNMNESQFLEVLKDLLYAFPAAELRVHLPGWMDALPADHPLKKEIYHMILNFAAKTKSLRDAESNISDLSVSENIENTRILEIEPGSGIVSCTISMPDKLYYGILSGETGFEITCDADLMNLLHELSAVKRSYDKISSALDQVKATGYGIVMPSPDEMHLEVPEIVRKGSNYGVKLKASAPSIHMMRADIQTEIHPIVGDEKQSEDLLQYLLQEYEGDTEKLWQSNIFGKSVYELVNEGLGSKLKRMPEQSRFKLQSTLTRIINEGCSSLFCILLS